LQGSFLGALASFLVALARFRHLGLPRLAESQPRCGLVGAGDEGGFVAGDSRRPIFLPRLLLGLLQQRGSWLTVGIAAVSDRLQVLGRRQGERHIVERASAARQQQRQQGEQTRQQGEQTGQATHRGFLGTAGYEGAGPAGEIRPMPSVL